MDLIKVLWSYLTEDLWIGWYYFIPAVMGGITLGCSFIVIEYLIKGSW